MIISTVERFCAAFIPDQVDTAPELGGYITHSFINTSAIDIVVVDRNNEVTVIDKALPGATTNEPGLTVKMTRYHPTEKNARASLDYIRGFGNLFGCASRLFQDTATTHQKGFTRSNMGGVHVCRRFFVPVNKIENAGALFEENTGLVLGVSGHDNLQDMVHPDSNEFRVLRQNAPLYDNKPVGRLFEIVDSLRQHRERFVYVGNGVLRVNAVVDSSRSDGLYVTEVQCKGGNRSSSTTVRYDFEEGYKIFGLYLSREEAETGGNPGLAAQRELEELKAKIARDAVEMKHREQVQTHENTLVERRIRTEQSTLDHTLETSLAIERLRTAQLQENQKREDAIRNAEFSAYSNNLRSSSEMFKYVPVFIAGCAALLGGLALWKR